MSQRNDGGQAFPRGAGPEGSNYCNGELGMSLRDYFAAAALQGLLAWAGQPGSGQLPPGDTAAEAYEYADALLSARRQRRAGPEGGAA
jgi:hypothetical protein